MTVVHSCLPSPPPARLYTHHGYQSSKELGSSHPALGNTDRHLLLFLLHLDDDTGQVDAVSGGKSSYPYKGPSLPKGQRMKTYLGLSR